MSTYCDIYVSVNIAFSLECLQAKYSRCDIYVARWDSYVSNALLVVVNFVFWVLGCNYSGIGIRKRQGLTIFLICGDYFRWGKIRFFNGLYWFVFGSI